MKIGIITVHRAYNYGSVLQCYALQEYLKNLGHDVWVIDYRQKWTDAVYKPFSLYYVWQFIKRRDIHAVIGYWRARRERKYNLGIANKIFSSFCSDKLHLTASCRNKIPQDFDLYVIGSDQLWSYQCVGGEDKVYQGQFKHSRFSKVIGYAISSSTDSLYKMGSDRLKQILANFDKISLREKNNSEIVEQLTGITLPVTIDPTLLPDEGIWNSMINADKWNKRNYIVIYQARSVAGNPTYLYDKASIVALEEDDIEIIDLSSMTYSVDDFISAIKYAKYVFTTSFHAVVFSMLMETPCYAVCLGDGLDVRYVDFLKNVGLEKEIVDIDFIPTSLDVDFTIVKKKLEIYRKRSQNFLEIF
ncbi:polysaccharide pyruvyl transferase family protein [Phocaeicola coprocola]|uniref:polysaccharide pyruvyl transferase family protein n=1 Tax=Phocaeicola coprocola TaxID=310298 RepID=UPI0026DC5186|nr:polysaccharide pyruvyl transferase family protein [Phocaeicola coprocola]